MKLKERLYLACARLFPHKYKNHLEKEAIYANMHINVNDYLGSTTLLSLIVALSISIIPYVTKKTHIAYPIAATLSFFFIELIAYLLIYFKAEDRTKRVEAVLPDALQLVAANVRAGMTPYKALKSAARKEFGPLAEEIHHATSMAMGTESFSDVLGKMSKRIKSEMLERAIKLFSTAMRSGGHLATLLEELAKDIEETRSLRNEMLASTKTYISFIMFTIIIGTPLLLSISIQFIDVITNMQSNTGTASAGFGLGSLAGDIAITADFLIKLSIVLLLVTSLLASILLGTIQEGKPKYGLKYAPIIGVGSIIAFVFLRYAIANFFSSIT